MQDVAVRMHMVVQKLKNDPGICKLIQKAALAWDITQNSLPHDNISDTNSILIQEGENAKATVLQYVDWLVTTCNPVTPNSTSSTSMYNCNQ